MVLLCWGTRCNTIPQPTHLPDSPGDAEEVRVVLQAALSGFKSVDGRKRDARDVGEVSNAYPKCVACHS